MAFTSETPPGPPAGASTAPPVSRTVDVDGPVHYWRWPGRDAEYGGRTIVCVHGHGEDHFGWVTVVPALARYGTVVAPDLPGFGLTPRLGRRLTLPAGQRFLSRFLAAAVGEPAVLVGSSFGGGIAAFQASVEPHTVDALVLSSAFVPPWFGGARAPRVLLRLVADRFRDARRMRHRETPDPSDPEEMLEVAHRAVDDEHLDEETIRRQLRLHSDEPTGRGRFRSHAEGVASMVAWAATAWRVRRVYDAIRCPVLMVHGVDDVQVPVAFPRAQQRRHPDWRLAELDGEGHVARLDDPTDWLGAFDELVRALPARP